VSLRAGVPVVAGTEGNTDVDNFSAFSIDFKFEDFLMHARSHLLAAVKYSTARCLGRH
jgi:hypothetical protein